MARQGTYVTVPGGNTNWAEGISTSLNTLSKSLLDQGLEKKEEEERKLQREIQKEQFNRNLDISSERNRLTAERDKADEAYRKSEGDYRKEQDKKAEKESELEKALAKEYNRLSNESNGVIEYSLEDYAENQQEAFNNTRKLLDTVSQTTKNALLSEGNPEAIKDAVTSYRTILEKQSDLGKDAIEDLVNERRDRLMAFSYEKDNMQYDDKSLQSRAEELVGSLLNPWYDNIDESIKSGEGILQKEQIAAIIKRLPENLRENFSFAQLSEGIKNQITAASRSELLQSEKDRYTAEQERRQATIDNIVKIRNAFKDSKSSSGGTLTFIEGMEKINELKLGGFGDNDDGQAKAFYEDLVNNEGVSPEAAFGAILSIVQEELAGTNFINSADNLKRGKEIADAIQEGFKGETDSSFDTEKAKKELENALYGESKAPKTLKEIELNRLFKKSTEAPRLLDIEERYIELVNKGVVPGGGTGTGRKDLDPGGNTKTDTKTNSSTETGGDLNPDSKDNSISFENDSEGKELLTELEQTNERLERGNLPTRKERSLLQRKKRIENQLEELPGKVIKDRERYNRLLKDELSLPEAWQTRGVINNYTKKLANINARLKALGIDPSTFQNN